MENLRWIILGVGLFVVLIIYLLGRNKNKSRNKISDLPESLSVEELPDVSTTEEFVGWDNLQNNDEHSIPELNNFDLDQELVAKVAASVDEVLPEVMTSGSVLKSQVKNLDDVTEVEPQEAVDEVTEDVYEDDLIVIHVQAKSAFFSGTDLLKVINDQQLKFGDMNIYHHYDDTNAITFSMSNMLQPGHFEPDTIADMRTPGVILFMQLSLVNDPEEALKQMIHCTEALAQDLDAKVTSSTQQDLTAQDIDNFRAKAAYFK